MFPFYSLADGLFTVSTGFQLVFSPRLPFTASPKSPSPSRAQGNNVAAQAVERRPHSPRMHMGVLLGDSHSWCRKLAQSTLFPRPFPLTRLAVFPLTASHCRSKLVTKFSQLNHLLCEMGTPHSISARVISCLIPTRGIKSSYAWKIKHVVNGDGFCFLGGGGGRRVVSVCVQGLLDVFHFQSIAHRHLAV